MEISLYKGVLQWDSSAGTENIFKNQEMIRI